MASYNDERDPRTRLSACILLLSAADGMDFLMSEVPLYRVTVYLAYTKPHPPGPYRRPTPRVPGGFYGGGRFLMSEVPLKYCLSAER